MIKITNVLLMGIILSFISCSESDVLKPVDEEGSLLFHDYINTIGFRYKPGDLIKFNYDKFNNDSYVFSFYNYRRREGQGGDYVTAFSMKQSSIQGLGYRLEMRKLDSSLIVGQVYTKNVSFSWIYKDYPEEYSKTATRAELLFTKFKNPGRVEGTFKAYRGSTLWCDGNFSFLLK
jgi:hypothetical protein